MQDDSEDTTIYKVVINDEEQYSIWPAHRDNPAGWYDVGHSGLKDACLDVIAEKMDGHAAAESEAPHGRAVGTGLSLHDRSSHDPMRYRHHRHGGPIPTGSRSR